MSALAAQFPTLIRLAALLAAGWRWWTGELGRLLPRAGRLSTRRLAALTVMGKELVATDSPESGAQALAWLPLPLPPGARVPELEGRPVELRLPPQIALRKTLTLPAAAAENLRQVVTFEMDRETPFRAEDVRFDALVTGRSDRQLTVEILVVPRLAAEQAVAAARQLGVAVTRLTVALADGSGTRFDLRTPEERPAQRRPSRLLIGIVAGLAVPVLALPVLVNAWTAAQLAERTAAVQQRAALALRLRDELEQRQGGGSALDRRKERTPPAIALLAELTRRLPDGVWLDQLRLSQGEVRLYGYAPASAELIALLEASPLLEKVRFETGVMQDPLRKRERFQIVTAVEMPATTEAAP